MFEVDRTRYIHSSIVALLGSKTTLAHGDSENKSNPITNATMASVKRALQKVVRLTDASVGSLPSLPLRPVSTSTSTSEYQKNDLIIDRGVVKQLILSQRSSGVNFPL